MATTVSVSYSRRFIRAGWSAPGGADEITTRTEESYNAMLAAAWEEATDATPGFPVHEYDRARPSGDCYAAVWGYSAPDRTERVCHGEVIYHFPVPANAMGRAKIRAFALTIAGDRYLAEGVNVRFSVTTTADPAPEIASGVEAESVCATSSQGGLPNERHGVTATASVNYAIDRTDIATVRVWMHLRSPLAKRGAWVEGGAMLADPKLEITFDVDVTPDDYSQFPLDTGLFSSSATVGQYLLSAPAASIRATYELGVESGTFGELSSATSASVVRNVMALAQASPDLYAIATSETERPAKATFGVGACGIGVSSEVLKACAFSFTGFTGFRKFSRVKFESAINLNCHVRLVVFGISGPLSIAATAGSTPASYRIGSVLPSYRSVFGKALLAGTAQSMDCETAIGDSVSGTQFVLKATEGTVASVPGVTLAATDIRGGAVQDIAFDHPFESGWVSTLVFVMVPNGIPTLSSTASGTMTAVFSGTRFEFAKGSSHTVDITASLQNGVYVFDNLAGATYVRIFCRMKCTVYARLRGIMYTGQFEVPIGYPPFGNAPLLFTVETSGGTEKAKIQYRLYDFYNNSVTLTAPDGTAITADVSTTGTPTDGETEVVISASGYSNSQWPISAIVPSGTITLPATLTFTEGAPAYSETTITPPTPALYE